MGAVQHARPEPETVRDYRAKLAPPGPRRTRVGMSPMGRVGALPVRRGSTPYLMPEKINRKFAPGPWVRGLKLQLDRTSLAPYLGGMNELITIWLILIATHGVGPRTEALYWGTPYYTAEDCERARAEMDGDPGYRAQFHLPEGAHMTCVTEKVGRIPRG